MSKFTFNIAGVGTAAGTTAGAAVSASTRDQDLTYTGDDSVVWDRINTERLRRNLLGLAQIGFARPSADAGRSAQVFEIQGPPGATLEQARAIFNQQVNTGGLVGLKIGDAISAVTQSAAGLRAAQSQIGQLGTTATEQVFARLKTAPLTSPISLADFARQAPPNFDLGLLSSQDIQGLMAQTAATINQPANLISAAKGVGKFGLDVNKLEVTGFVKPGTAQSFARSAAPLVSQKDIDEAAKINAAGGDVTPEQIARNRQLNSFLTPAAFTGKLGVTNLDSVLRSENIQNFIQGDVLKQSYNSLVNSGVVKSLGNDATQLAATVQTAATFGIATAENFVKGIQTDNIASIVNVAKAAEYAKTFATNLVSGALGKIAGLFSRGGSIYAGTQRPRSTTNTVNRATVNASVTSIVGNPKIPTPAFAPRDRN